MEIEVNEPGIEINGQIVYSSVAAFPMARCVPAKILFGKGLGKRVNEKFQIDVNDWYSRQDSAIKFGERIYHMNHKKNGRIMFDPNSGAVLEGISHYSYSKNGNEYILKSDSVYPCAFVKGLLTPVAQKFEPNAIVIHDDITTCRKRGDKFCTYKIRW